MKTKKSKQLEKIEKKIIIPVYYAEINKRIVIDEDSIKEEFEAKLKKIVETKTFKVSVNWDTDNQKVDLPKIVEIPNYVEDDDVADYLSDEYGWCVNSYTEIN